MRDSDTENLRGAEGYNHEDVEVSTPSHWDTEERIGSPLGVSEAHGATGQSSGVERTGGVLRWITSIPASGLSTDGNLGSEDAVPRRATE
jgi:hypothetical protein